MSELTNRLREHAALHGDLGRFNDEQAQWERDLLDAADALEAQQAEMKKRLRQQGEAWAADAKRKDAEIERLRGLLRDMCERMKEAATTASVLTGQLPQYSEGQQMLRRLATIMGDSAKHIRATLGTQADQPCDGDK